MRALVIFFALLPLTAGLKCYNGVTSSTGDVANTPQVTCPVGSTQCFRQTTKSQGQTVVLEGCDTSAVICAGISNGNCHKSNTYGVSIETCCCGENLCNTENYFQRVSTTTEYFRPTPRSASRFLLLLAISVIFLGQIV